MIFLLLCFLEALLQNLVLHLPDLEGLQIVLELLVDLSPSLEMSLLAISALLGGRRLNDSREFIYTLD